MAYKTILTVVSNAAKAAHLDAAIAVAQREEAHLDILCLGIDHTQTGYFYAGASTYMFQQVVDRVMEEITALQETLRARLASENIRWSVDSARRPCSRAAARFWSSRPPACPRISATES